MSPVTLHCHACRKQFKAKSYELGKTYRCPACKGNLEPETDSAVIQAVEEELDFKDAPAPVPREILVRLGKYLIDGEIARGGMGVVYKGRQEGLDRVVAIKMLHSSFAGDVEMVRRFHRESRAAAKLRHPHIVAIHEVGDHEGRPFFTMDYIPGQTLDGLFQNGPLKPERGAAILRDVARAVHYAHEQGIIHRDLKPGNVLIDAKGEPHVTDFGLARDMDSRSMLSVTGDVMGTPAYMSPEQAEGKVHEIERRTDVYALGAILYKILTGRPPFEGATVAATVYKVVHEDAVDPAKLNPRAPADLAAVCLKAIDKDRGRRYASAADLAADLDRYLAGEPVTAKPPSWQDRMRRKLRRNRKAVLAAGGVAALALVVIVALLLFLGKSELDLIEEGLAKKEMRPTAMASLLKGLPGFKEKARALALARKAVGEGRDEASRELAYAAPVADLADAYSSHLTIEKPEKLRIRLLQILAGFKHRGSVGPVIDILRSTRGEVRIAAIRFLKAVPDVQAYYDLGVLVADRECGEEARQALERQYLDNVITVFNPAGGKSAGALAEMGAAVADYNKQIEEALGERPKAKGPKDAVEAAIAALRSQDPKVRVKAAYELGNSADARAREPLLGALQDGDDGVSKSAAAALARVGVGEEKEKVAQLLKHAKPGVRRNAAYVLGKSGDKSLRPALESAYKDESDPEAKYAMEDALVALR